MLSLRKPLKTVYFYSHIHTGPLKKAEADFIRLLWEQNIPLVVMVTKLIEGDAVSYLFN